MEFKGLFARRRRYSLATMLLATGGGMSLGIDPMPGRQAEILSLLPDLPLAFRSGVSDYCETFSPIDVAPSATCAT